MKDKRLTKKYDTEGSGVQAVLDARNSSVLPATPDAESKLAGLGQRTGDIPKSSTSAVVKIPDAVHFVSNAGKDLEPPPADKKLENRCQVSRCVMPSSATLRTCCEEERGDRIHHVCNIVQMKLACHQKIITNGDSPRRGMKWKHLRFVLSLA